jgi:hypothetical protein
LLFAKISLDRHAQFIAVLVLIMMNLISILIFYFFIYKRTVTGKSIKYILTIIIILFYLKSISFKNSCCNYHPGALRY